MIKPPVRIGITAALLIAIGPLYVALPFRENVQTIEQFLALAAINLAFMLILTFLWEAVQAISRKRILVPFGLAIATFAIISLLNAIAPDAEAATSSFLGAQNASVYLAYYYLLDLVFLIILYAGIVEVLRKYNPKITGLHFTVVGVLVLAIWLAMGGFGSSFNTFLSVIIVALIEGSRLFPRVEKDDEQEIISPSLRY